MTATTFTWTSTGNSNWATTADWNNGTTTGTVATGAGNNAFINEGNVFVGNTQANIGNLNVDGGNLFVNNASQNLTINTDLALAAGSITLNGANNINVGGNFNVSGGTYNQSAGILTVTTNLLVTGGTFNESAGKVNVGNANFNAGTVNLGGNVDATTLLDVSGATVTVTSINVSAATFTMESGSVTQTAGTIKPTNISMTGGTFTESGGTLAPTKNITVGGGTFCEGSGTITAGNATLTAGNFNQSGGTITLTKNLGVSGGTFNQDVGTITVGNASFTGGADRINGTFNDKGALTVGGTTGHTTLNLSSGANVVVTGSATVSNSNNAVLSTINMAGGVLNLNASTLTFNGTANGGAITGFGTINGTGFINATTSNGGTINASGGTLTVAATVNNGVVLAMNGSATGSTLNIAGTAASAATITLNSANQMLEIGNSSGNLTISLAETVAGGTLNVAAGLLTDTGGITVSSGNFNIGGGTVNTSTGNLTVNGTGNLFQTGGQLNVGNANLSAGIIDLGGSVNDAALLNVSGTAAVTASGSNVTAANLNVAGGSFNETGGATTVNSNLTVTGGTFNQASGTATVGNASFNNSSDTINGTFTDKGTLNVGSSANGSNATLTIGGTANVTGVVTVSNSNNGSTSSINMAGGTLTLNGGGLTFSGTGNMGSVSGTGVINGTGSIGGAGTITAVGGTLTLATTVNSGVVLAVANATGSVLNIAGTANSTGAITLNSANQTLEIGNSSGNLTIGAAETVNGGTISMQGGTLNASGGLTVATGGTLIGSGTVNGTISDSGNGLIEASGGVLDLQGNVGASTTLTIANSASSVLQIDGGGGSSDTIAFAGTAGTANFNISTTGVVVGITGMDIGTNNSTPTDAIIFNGSNVSLVGPNSFNGTGGTITIDDNGHNSTLTLSNLQGTTTQWFVDSKVVGGNTEVFLSNVVCFAAGTRIGTPDGEVAVETLRTGDRVLTLVDGELTAQPVKWMGRRRMDLTAHPRPETVAPVRIQRGAFAENMPHSDLLVSPDHALLVDGKLITARQLINGTTISQEMGWTAVEYFHIELEAHAILLAEGLPAESYLDTGNRSFFSNADEPMLLHPDLTDETDCPTREAASCAPFVWDEDGVRPVWQTLADRAATLGQPVPTPETTGEPELRIIAKGRTVKPLYNEGGLSIFVLPKGATEVRIVSRANAPTDTRPWAEDRRRLGVYVERISLRGVDELRDIALDHPDLKAGWWAVERDGAVLRRWTDGDAVVSLPAMAGATMLEVRASGADMRYVVPSDAGAEVADRKTVRR